MVCSQRVDPRTTVEAQQKLNASAVTRTSSIGKKSAAIIKDTLEKIHILSREAVGVTPRVTNDLVWSQVKFRMVFQFGL